MWVLTEAKYLTEVLAFIEISFPTTYFGIWSAIFIWVLKEYTCNRSIMLAIQIKEILCSNNVIAGLNPEQD